MPKDSKQYMRIPHRVRLSNAGNDLTRRGMNSNHRHSRIAQRLLESGFSWKVVLDSNRPSAGWNDGVQLVDGSAGWNDGVRLAGGQAHPKRKTPPKRGSCFSAKGNLAEYFWFVTRRGLNSSRELPRSVMTGEMKPATTSRSKKASQITSCRPFRPCHPYPGHRVNETLPSEPQPPWLRW
jgi:hypothetical protein